jgi:hypothetical protein
MARKNGIRMVGITADEAAIVVAVLGTRANRAKYEDDPAFWRALDKYQRLATALDAAPAGS